MGSFTTVIPLAGTAPTAPQNLLLWLVSAQAGLSKHSEFLGLPGVRGCRELPQQWQRSRTIRGTSGMG